MNIKKGGKKMGKVLKQERVLLVIGIALLSLLILIAVYSFVFLINKVLPAINPNNSVNTEGEIHFNLKGFEELGL